MLDRGSGQQLSEFFFANEVSQGKNRFTQAVRSIFCFECSAVSTTLHHPAEFQFLGSVMLRASLWTILLVNFLYGASIQAAGSTPFQQFADANCYDCHGEFLQESDFRLDTLSEDLSNPATFATWAKVYDRIRKGEMPPAGADRPDGKAQAQLLTLMHSQLQDADRQRQNQVKAECRCVGSIGWSMSTRCATCWRCRIWRFKRCCLSIPQFRGSTTSPPLRSCLTFMCRVTLMRPRSRSIQP